MIQTIGLVLLFGGITSVVIGYMKQVIESNPPQIEYRYIPRTFEEEQMNPVKVSQLYSSMFAEPSPWIAGMKLGNNESKHQGLNRYYISQS